MKNEPTRPRRKTTPTPILAKSLFMKRAKIPSNLPGTRQEAELLAEGIAEMQLIVQADKAEIDTLVNNIKSAFAERTRHRLKAIGEELARLATWAERNRAEFGDQRSITTGAARFGWQTHPHAARPLSHEWTWERIVNEIRTRRLDWSSFIHVKYEANKEALIESQKAADSSSMAAGDTMRKALADVGVQVIQEESFYVQPNK